MIQGARLVSCSHLLELDTQTNTTELSLAGTGATQSNFVEGHRGSSTESQQCWMPFRNHAPLQRREGNRKDIVL